MAPRYAAVSDRTRPELKSASDLLFDSRRSFAGAIADSDGVPSDASGYRRHVRDIHATVKAGPDRIF
jgi:hypothetical protein